MKTAVAIPDELFDEADRLARRLHRTRSRLYADALREYLARHSPDEVTSALNRACDEVETDKESAEEAVIAAASSRLLSRVEW